MCFTRLLLAVIIPQHEKRFLLLAVIRDQAFAVEIIFKMRQRAPRTAKIFKHTRRSSTQERNALQHRDLVLVKTLLILLGPTGQRIAVIAKQRVASELTHDQRL